MALNLKQSNVALNQTFDPMLNHLQANILKAHGRKFAHHLFFSFDNTKKDAAKNWIKTFADTRLTSAKKQLEDTLAFNKTGTDGGTVYTLSLSKWGYHALGLVTPADIAFKVGLKDRANILKDKLGEWEPEFLNDIHMLILVADDIAQQAKKNAQMIIQEVEAFGTLIKDQRGNVLKMKDTGLGIEHFGYADGVSQPMYLADEINGQSQPRRWDDQTELDRVLVKEKNSNNEDCFGSYFVFRKLEQNVKCFKIAEGDTKPDDTTDCKRIVPERKNGIGKVDDELSGASIVGRFENGTPVTMLSDPLKVNPHTITNDFDYSDDKEGLKCPFHAHIRLMNPRNGDPIAKPNELLPHRITRRGMPYDDHDKAHRRIPDDKITDITDDMLDTNRPLDKVGLLFMCYQSAIETQFEILQAFWANQGIIVSGPTRGQDSLITQGTDAPRSISSQWGKAPQSNPFSFSGFVKMKGGEYFYTPSIAFLKELA